MKRSIVLLAALIALIVRQPSRMPLTPGVARNPELSGAAWSPYLVGALIGVLTWLTFLFSDKPLGASTAYARVAGMLGKLVAPRHTDVAQVLPGQQAQGRLGSDAGRRRDHRRVHRGVDRRRGDDELGAADVGRTVSETQSGRACSSRCSAAR